ncbi:MAG: hypothetical protein J3Q66DRAFT_358527 [Benniella sp.]|nr:MAG: hypothetical protein J3Q66DRAFT_358527 [Benniella sp.]
MPQEPLPLECLLEILHILSQEYDTDTMARLLCVNKSFCVATIPFLYQDCFNTNMHRRSNKSLEDSMIQLIRTLLRQVYPHDRIPGFLRAAYLSNDHQDDIQPTVESPVFKYGHFIRSFMLDDEVVDSMFAIFGKSVMEYAAIHQLYEKYVVEEHLSVFLHNELWDGKAIGNVLKIDLHQQLMWTLSQDHLEATEKLMIPLLDIERYIDHVHQFTSLSRVNFTVPMVLQGAWLRLVEEQEEWQNGRIKAMERFVQQHTAIHKNILRSAEVPLLPETGLYSVVDAQFEILSLLPPLHNPRSIDSLNWCALVARLSDTNVSYVESIDLSASVGSEYDERAFDLLRGQPPFLPRCRALRKLAMETLGPDMFQWAVLEKKQRDAGHQQNNIQSRRLYSQEHGYHNEFVPLRSIKLHNTGSLALVQELNDIAFAFDNSLEELVVSDRGSDERPKLTDLATTPQVIHGHGWDLPCLRTLSLAVSYFQLHLVLDALQRSSALERLSLRDTTTTYNHHDILSWSSVHLPHLKKLELTGSPALRFNLESLHHSPCLEELTLTLTLSLTLRYTISRRDASCYYIPSPWDLEREDSDDHELSGTPGTMSQGYPSIGKRPRWTWDWHLPMLYRLSLGAVFAYKFDFQWLQQLPNLQHLQLNTFSSAGQLHERHITLKDLARRGQHQKDEDGQHILSDQYVSLPKLESIHLHGHWVIGERVVGVLCLVVCPNLRSVCLERYCRGYTHQEWVTLSRKMPQMERLDLRLSLTCDKAKKLGLIPEHKLVDEQRNKKRVKYVIDWNIYYDVWEP